MATFVKRLIKTFLEQRMLQVFPPLHLVTIPWVHSSVFTEPRSFRDWILILYPWMAWCLLNGWHWKHTPQRPKLDFSPNCQEWISELFGKFLIMSLNVMVKWMRLHSECQGQVSSRRVLCKGQKVRMCLCERAGAPCWMWQVFSSMIMCTMGVYEPQEQDLTGQRIFYVLIFTHGSVYLSFFLVCPNSCIIINTTLLPASFQITLTSSLNVASFLIFANLVNTLTCHHFKTVSTSWKKRFDLTWLRVRIKSHVLIWF